jgi:carboxypeptidase C (cathepsin A)
MRPTFAGTGGSAGRIGAAMRFGLATLLAAWLAGCGGGGTAAAPSGLEDTTAYSVAPSGSLLDYQEHASVTQHQVVIAGAPVAYTARAGHYTALAPGTGSAEASFFYVAYTVAPPPGQQRPIVFFFNGGPGSATVWLHLGSFAPRRIVTNAPSVNVPQPFQLVDNAESLIDVADLVFVDAVGTGWSTAIAPNTNQTFWGVDADAAVTRDFISRYAQVNNTAGAPTFIFGESYGTTRAAVLAHRMVSAGMRLDGVVLLSSILDYNSACDMFGAGLVSCEGSLPTYGMTGAWFNLVQPPPADADAYAQQLRDFATTPYGPAAQAWVQARTPPAPALLDQLVALTGAPRELWVTNVDLDADAFRSGLVAGQLLGRYDARIAAALGTALANSGDPSSAVITPPFTAAAHSLFFNELQYQPTAPYPLLSNAIASWNFTHDGRGLPDTVPDLGAALAASPNLRVLSLAGYHDLATPFHQTELDLDRLGAEPRIARRVYAGGHMTYLDDTSRPRLKAALAAFITASGPIPAGATTMAAQGAGPRTPAMAASTGVSTAQTAQPAPASVTSVSEPADRSALAQGGDPWLPPALRLAPSQASPRGDALRALIARKVADGRADPSR